MTTLEDRLLEELAQAEIVLHEARAAVIQAKEEVDSRTMRIALLTRAVEHIKRLEYLLFKKPRESSPQGR